MTELLGSRALNWAAYNRRMTFNLSEVIRGMDDLKTRGLITEYAIGGAVASLFWGAEVTHTDDLDVFVVLKQGGLIVTMEPIYDWARELNHQIDEKGHVVISGFRVEFLPAEGELKEEAVKEARSVDVGDWVTGRVIGPEHLIAMWLTPPANTFKRRARASELRRSAYLDAEKLDLLLKRYDLSW
jgi:hypothetical protein